jgi:flagellar biosynthetic protein FliP
MRARYWLGGLGLLLLLGAPALAAPPSEVNPLVILDDVGEAVSGLTGMDGENPLDTSINMMLLLTVLSLAPALLILCTCFTRVVIVLGLLRQALGTQGLPPNQIIFGLSLFITIVVMAPTAQRVYDEGIRAYADGEVTDASVAWDRAKQPLRDFMFSQIEATGNYSSLYMLLDYRGVDTSDPASLTRADVDMLTLIPAYVLSELKVAFLIGFRLYLPFLVIDLVVASMLVSMGMFMLPPVLISLPFKLLLFVLVDGWSLVVGSLLTGFVQPDIGMSTSTVMPGGP